MRFLIFLGLFLVVQSCGDHITFPHVSRRLGDLINEFQVNTYTTNVQQKPAIAALTGGGFVIVWESWGQDGWNGGIYGQRFSSSGVALGSEFRVNTYTNDHQLYPAVAALSTGGFVISWSSYGQVSGPNNYEVIAQRYDASGSAVGAEFQVNTYVSSTQYDPAVVGLSGGAFIITWASHTQDGDNYGVYAQRYSSAGATVGSEFQVSTYSTGHQQYPAITSFSDDSFIVVWASEGQDGSGYGIYAQRFDSLGSAVGVEFQINTYTANAQRDPAIATLPGDEFVVVWHSVGQDGSDAGIYARLFDSSANPDGSEFRVNTYTPNAQTLASVSALSDGQFLITWASSGQDGDGYGIFAQRFDSSGAARGPEIQVNTYTTSNQQNAAVAALASGWMVTWQSYGQDGANEGIFAQFVPTSYPTSAPTSIPSSIPTSIPSSVPSAIPTSVPTSPTSVPTSAPSAVPTSIPTSPTSIPTSIPSAAPTTTPTSPTSIPTSVPTSIPTASPTSSAPSLIPTSVPTTIPTSQPTALVSDHVVVHLYDLHGDGWLDNVYLKVSHVNGTDMQLHSLHCSCKVVRIFEEDMSLSLWRNRTVSGPKGDVVPYEWEALWTVGYSDGLTETDFGIVGDINSQVEIRNYALNSSQHTVDIDLTNPANKCIPPKPKPKAPPVVKNTTDQNDVANTTEPSQPDTPSPTVDVRLALQTTIGESWCDDSGSTSVLACDKEHHLSTDAVLPNVVLYPRYYISRTDDNRVVASGTLREDVTEWITSVKLLREGSYVFSVSGTYTASSGTVSWDFCGEQGGINERLHFNMVKGVCRSHYIEEVSGDLTCYESLNGLLLNDHIDVMQLSDNLQYFRGVLPVVLFVVGALMVVALMLAFLKMRSSSKRQFLRLDTTEHNN